MYMAVHRGSGGFGGIFDPAVEAISRGINEGISAALPTVRRNIEEVISGTVNTVLPRLRTEMVGAISEGLTRGASVAKTEIAKTTSDLMPALEQALEDGADKIAAKYRKYLIVGSVVVLAAMGTMIYLQSEQVRLLRRGRS